MSKLDLAYNIKSCLRIMTRLENLKEYELDKWGNVLDDAINCLLVEMMVMLAWNIDRKFVISKKELATAAMYVDL